MQALYRRVYHNERFHALERRRSRFSWTLAAVMSLIYYSFILVIAFSPELFAQRISEGSVITWGIPTGLAVIISSFVLTGVYVFRANRVFDRLRAELLEEITSTDKNSHD